MPMSRFSPRRPSPNSRGAVAALLCVLALVGLLAGCGSDKASDKSTSGGTTAAGAAPDDTLAPPTRVDGAEATIKAIDNDYEPKHLLVKAGTKVTFDNTGRNIHDVVPADKSAFDFTVGSDDFQPGNEKSFTFEKPGTYHYYCSLHATATAGSMRGVITVEP